MTRNECNAIYSEVIDLKDKASLRRLCREDLFFLLSIGCKRYDTDNDFVYARCREIEQDDPKDDILDLWFREGYKSTIKTFAKNIQDILNNPDITIGIFSHTRPIAKAFLSQIKRELESNDFLKSLFPDILYENPKKESPKWSLDEGIVVKRKSNPKESTVEAHGLIDGQPTSKHYLKLNYDDIVTRESVTTPEMIDKVTNAWALSLNLGVAKEKGGVRSYIGTRYHQNDTYAEIIRRGAARPRHYYPTEDGKDDIEVKGKPILIRTEGLLEKRRSMGLYVYACQMLQNPHADKAMGFHPDWIKHYVVADAKGWNVYILADPASEKRKESDYTVIVAIGLASDGNYYLLDGIRDRLNLTERTKALFRFVRKWRPRKVGYEKYGKDSDIEHINYIMQHENYRFNIVGLGGSMAKNDRIRRLVPVFENGRFYIPHNLNFVDVNGQVHDFVKDFIDDEYITFPVSSHDDMLDCMARILDEDLNAVFPKAVGEIDTVIDSYDPLKIRNKRREVIQAVTAKNTMSFREFITKK